MIIDELWETITTIDKVMADLQEGRRNLAKQPITKEVKKTYTELTVELNNQKERRHHLSCEVNALLGDKYHLLPNGNVLIVDNEGEVFEKEGI